MTSKTRYVLALLSAVMLLSSCSDNKKYEMAACALSDVSGTYAKEKASMVRIIQAGILPKMLPGDSLSVIQIDDSSYNENSIIGQLKLDYRPSEANSQRMTFSKVLHRFAEEKAGSRYTDISGAMMLCSDYLRNTHAGTQVMIIFSDMKEELKPGLRRNFRKKEFDNINIAAMNVIKLNEDNANPEVYRSRMEAWGAKVMKHGAKSWKADLEPADLTGYLDALR